MTLPSVNFEVEIQVSKRDENLYAATIMPFHVTGYADTFDGSIDRSQKGLDHLLEAYEADGNLTQFLDESGVEYTVTNDTLARDASMRRVKETIAYVGSH